MERITPKKNTVFFSLESRPRHWLSPYGGPYPMPQMERLAKQSLTFEGMTSAGSSTSLVLSSTISGRYPWEFARTDYRGTDWFLDNLFDDMTRLGRRTYAVGSETFFDEYFERIYAGPAVERVRLPTVGFSTTMLAEKVIDVVKSATEPVFVLAHPLPLRPCRRSAKPHWRNELEQFLWEDDLAIGMLLDQLDLDDTRLVVCADHGNSLGEHENVFSHAFYVSEPQVGVPCFVTDDAPRRIAGAHSSTQLRNLLLHHEIARPERVFADTLYVMQPHRVTMVRQDDWKYVAHYSWETAIRGMQEELYDLRFDPGEHRNLLHDVARHPMRGDFNHPCAWRVPGNGWGYDEVTVTTVANRLRRVIAELWSEGFLRHLAAVDPAAHRELEPKLAGASVTARLAVIGTLVAQCQEHPPCYEKRDAEAGPPTLPYPHPGLPDTRRNVNYSTIGAAPLGDLFRETR